MDTLAAQWRKADFHALIERCGNRAFYDDILLLMVESHRILKAIGKLEDD